MGIILFFKNLFKTCDHKWEFREKYNITNFLGGFMYKEEVYQCEKCLKTKKVKI